MNHSMPSASRSAGFCLSLDEDLPKISTLCPPVHEELSQSFQSGGFQLKHPSSRGTKKSLASIFLDANALLLNACHLEEPDDGWAGFSFVLQNFYKASSPLFLTDLWSQYSSFFIMWGLFLSWARCNKRAFQMISEHLQDFRGCVLKLFFRILNLIGSSGNQNVSLIPCQKCMEKT